MWIEFGPEDTDLNRYILVPLPSKNNTSVDCMCIQLAVRLMKPHYVLHPEVFLPRDVDMYSLSEDEISENLNLKLEIRDLEVPINYVTPHEFYGDNIPEHFQD